jgi:hypothetical protein
MSVDRASTIKAIRTALKTRSGKTWSVRGGTGTAWGWITISSPPARSADQWGTMTDDEAKELATLLGLSRVHHQGVSIAASTSHYREYIDRAEGRQPSVTGSPYWD